MRHSVTNSLTHDSQEVFNRFGRLETYLASEHVCEDAYFVATGFLEKYGEYSFGSTLQALVLDREKTAIISMRDLNVSSGKVITFEQQHNSSQLIIYRKGILIPTYHAYSRQ